MNPQIIPKNEVMGRILNASKFSKQFQIMDIQERQAALHELQDQLSAMQHQYLDHELPFKALNLAYQAVRIAWYAVGQNREGCQRHIEDLDRAVHWLVSDLCPALDEPESLPLPEGWHLADGSALPLEEKSKFVCEAT